MLTRDKASLAVLYGRRRLGKSTLVKRVLKNSDLYFLADRSEEQHQRALLAKVVAQKFQDFDKATYGDWESFFLAVNYRTQIRFSLCLDEFPYLAEQSPELPSVLQKLIDGRLLKYNLVLCGSSQHMMYGLFLDSTAPLYGRADEIMRLMPIRLPYMQEALHLDAVEAIEEYSVWGGVPRYWELRENNSSLDEALWHNVFSVNGVLYEEPVKLFQDDVKDVVKTSTIMSYVGTGANRLSEIAARCNEPATNLSRPLKKLIDLGFLEKDVPFGIDEKNAKKSLYKIADSFMAFYYQFVVPNRSFIELGRRLPIIDSLEANFSKYVSLRWENICRNAVTGNVIGDVLYGKAKRWWGTVLNENGDHEQMEFDVVAESIDKKSLLVGECKWTAADYADRLLEKLKKKVSLAPFAQGKKVIYILFLREKPLSGSQKCRVILPEEVASLLHQ